MTEKPQENLSPEYIKDRLNEIEHLLADFEIEKDRGVEAGDVASVGEAIKQMRELRKEKGELLEVKKKS